MQRNKTSIATFSTQSEPVKVAPHKAPKLTAEEKAAQVKFVEKTMEPAKPAEVDKLAKVISEQNILPSN